MLNHGLIRKEINPDDPRNRPNAGDMSSHAWDLSAEGPVSDRFVQLGLRAVPVVMEELSDANNYAREVAIVAAGRLCGPQAVEDVVPFFADKDPEVRLVACYTLIRMATPRAIQAAFAAACDGKDIDIRTFMIWQFGRSNEAEAVSALIVGLKHGKVEVRHACVFAFAFANTVSDDSRVLAALKEAMGDPDQEVRSWAADALEAVRLQQSATQPASDGSKGER